MALVSPPPPPLADTLPSTSPTPTPTPGPAATATPVESPLLAASSHLASASLPSSCHSPRPPHGTAGCSKAQRWCDNGSPSLVSFDSGSSYQPLSFREALLASASTSLASQAPVRSGASVAIACPRAGFSPRIVLRREDRVAAASHRPMDGDGWSSVLGRRERKEQRQQARPTQRPVPVNLRGKCFNCFSSHHRAVGCRASSPCFHCLASRHRSYWCPAKLASWPQVPPVGRMLIWRPVSAAQQQSEPAIAGNGKRSAAAGSMRGRRKRRSDDDLGEGPSAAEPETPSPAASIEQQQQADCLACEAPAGS